MDSEGDHVVLLTDLPAQAVTGPDGKADAFEIDAFRKHCLINGLDDIGLSLEKVSSIDAFEKKQAASQSWL